MKRLTREDILNLDDKETREVNIKGWKGSILVKSLSADEYVDIVEKSMTKDGKMSYRILYPLLIQYCCVEPKFEKADLDMLSKKRSGIIEKIAAEIMDLSELSLGGGLKNP